MNIYRLIFLFFAICAAYFSGTNIVSAQAGANANMADYWDGNAKLSYVRKWSGEGPSHIEFYNGDWYLFERLTAVDEAQRCPNNFYNLHTEVRKSTDRGATWGPAVRVISATIGTPWACAATDGDAAYDPVSNKWRLLFQCLGTPQDGNYAWRGCYAERAGADPMGPFTPVLTPSIQSKALWNQICDSVDDDCVALAGGPGNVRDEGTFNIFNFDGTYYWVSFHGYDGVRGYRGIAKTTDFVNWVAGNQSEGLPTDSIVDRYDALNWRESWNNGGPIGAGAASILLDNGFFYMAAEVSDTDLGCTPGQNWDWGLFRVSSTTLSNKSWEQLPQGNPFLYSSKMPDATAIGCGVAYGQLFKDPLDGATYLKHARTSNDPAVNQTYLYKLTKSSNVLKNGDLWMANTSYWQRYPIGDTNLVVYRDPQNASDGNQYMATNCGAAPNPCIGGQGFYQDVDIAGKSGYKLTFGGKFSTDSTNTGTLDLVVHQLDASMNILRNDIVRVNAGPTYQQTTSNPIQILAGTRTLRYQTYLVTSTATFRADEMFVNVEP